MIAKICKRNHTYIIGSGCTECAKFNSKQWKIAHQERRKLQGQCYYKSNKNKRKMDMSRWKANNLAKCAAIAAKRRAAILKATPPWLTENHLKEIKEMYQLAKDLAWLNQDGKPFHIDHIIPLQGDNICGLHVPWNLQLLPASDNFKKSNKL